MTPVSWHEMHRGFESSAGATQLHTSVLAQPKAFARDGQRSPSVVSLRHKRRHGLPVREIGERALASHASRVLEEHEVPAVATVEDLHEGIRPAQDCS
jgi:hypothetical protein